MARYLDDGELIAIDKVRDAAARCADETARFERGERGPLRCDGSILSEFDDASCGVASEVAMIVMRAMKDARAGFDPAFCWSTAATLLRNGWQRGHRLQPQVIRRGAAS